MKQYVLIFLGIFLLLSSVFFLFKLPIFDGMVIYDLNGVEQPVPSKISLSYFIGLGYQQHELKHIKDFYLIGTGYANAALILLGLPLMITYRVYLAKKKKEK